MVSMSRSVIALSLLGDAVHLKSMQRLIQEHHEESHPAAFWPMRGRLRWRCRQGREDFNSARPAMRPTPKTRSARISRAYRPQVHRRATIFDDMKASAPPGVGRAIPETLRTQGVPKTKMAFRLEGRQRRPARLLKPDVANRLRGCGLAKPDSDAPRHAPPARRPVRHLPRRPDPAIDRLCRGEAAGGCGLHRRGAGGPDLLRPARLQFRRQARCASPSPARSSPPSRASTMSWRRPAPAAA